MPVASQSFNVNNLKLLLLLSILLTAQPVSSQSFQNEADQYHTYWQQPTEGVVIANHANSKTQYTSAGLTNKAGIRPDHNTLFEIGSITKVFTAILLAEAVRENRAKFDDSVSTHLTHLKFMKESPFHTITLGALSTHTSGLPRLPIDLSEGANKDNPYAHYDDQRLEQSLVSLQEKQLNEPGEHNYSNYGVGLLGYVLTQIYDQSFRELLKEKILKPLEMNSTDVPTRFADLAGPTRDRLASPHVGGHVVSHWELGSLVGAGAMISSAEDLIKFGTAHWDVNTPAGLAESMKEVAKPRLNHQGLGWSIDGETLRHGGGTGGFITRLRVNPTKKTVRVILTNSGGQSYDVAINGNFASISGYWSGTLNTESEKLRLVSFISEGGRMVFYSIDQGNQAILSAKSNLIDNQFYFSFPAISGLYTGTLENRRLVGTVIRRGESDLPLRMEYTKEMPDILRDVLDKTMQGDLASLQGYWSGYLGGKTGLFVYVKTTPMGDSAVVELYSPDQGHEAIMVSSASLIGNTFKFHSDQVDGGFSGKLAKKGRSIKGSWRQVQTTPLNLYWSEDKPERE